MGIAEVRDAFVDGGAGELTCRQARLYYDHGTSPNMQVLEFDGHYTGGEAFKIISDPFAGDIDPNVMARQVARGMVEKLLQGRAAVPEEGYG